MSNPDGALCPSFRITVRVRTKKPQHRKESSMKKSARLLSIGAIAAVAMLGLGSCAAADASGGGEGGGDHQKVTFWGAWTDAAQVAQLEAQAAAFNDSQTQYDVTYVPQALVEQKLLTAMVSGEVPDVVLWDRFATSLYVPKGALVSIDDKVKEDSVDTNQFYEQALGELKVDDKLYGLPLLVDNRSLFYNKTVFDEAGVKPPTNWDELKSVAEQVTLREGGKLTRAGFSLDDLGLFSGWLGQAGGTMLNADSTKTAFNSPEGVEVLNFWSSLVDAGVYQQGFGKGVNAFAQGNLAMGYDGPWALADLDKVDGLEYGVTAPVAGPGGDQGAGMGGFGLVIPKGAKNEDGAWAFMKWWTTQPENDVDLAKISGWIPANIEAAHDPYFLENEHYSAFIEALDFAKVRPTVTGYSDVEAKALIPALESFMSGELSAEQALKQAQEQGDQILAENR